MASRYRSPLDSPADSRRQARNATAFGDQLQRTDTRRRNDAVAVGLGGRPGMSEADQNTLAGAAQGDSSTALGSTPADALVPRMRTADPTIGAAANRAVASSSVPTGSSYERNVAGATAASPVAYQPTSAKLNLPDQSIRSGGAAAADAGLARNLALTQPGGGRGLLSPVARPLTANPTAVAATPGIGNVVSDGRYASALDAVATPGTAYGTGSVRTAGADEKLGKAVVTADGVSRTGPQDYAGRNAGLQKQHPNLFVAGSPENAAFVAHAKQYGVPDAYDNVDSLMAGVKNQNPLGSQTPQTAKNDIQSEPTPERIAQLDKTVADTAPPIAQRAGEAIRSTGLGIVGAGRAVFNGARDAVSGLLNAPKQIAKGIFPSSPVDSAESMLAEERKKRLKSPVAAN